MYSWSIRRAPEYPGNLGGDISDSVATQGQAFFFVSRNMWCVEERILICHGQTIVNSCFSSYIGSRNNEFLWSMNECVSFASISYPRDLLSPSISPAIYVIDYLANSGLAHKAMWVQGSTSNQMLAQEPQPLVIVTVPSVTVAARPSAVQSQEVSLPSYQVPRCFPNQVQLLPSPHLATPDSILKQSQRRRNLGNLQYACEAGEANEEEREEDENEHEEVSIEQNDEALELNSSAVLKNDGQVVEPKIRYSHRSQWLAMYEELCNYQACFGTCHIHHTYTENVPLLRWVKRQRYQYKLLLEGKRSRMTKERLKALEAIGFVWHYQEASWYHHLADLKAFKREHGHCNVPSKLDENPKFAAWVRCQRKQYQRLRKNRQSNMTPQRIVELESVGFEWETKRSKRRNSNK